MSNEELCVIVDGNNVVMRNHHAFMRTGLSTSSGLQTGALFGSILSHISLVRTLKPTHMVWYFDKGRSRYRLDKFSDYKGTREHKTDLSSQFSAFDHFLSLMGVRYYGEQGVEADDLIAASIKRWNSKIPKVIVSADHDLRQLVQEDPLVTVFKPKQGKTPQKVYTRKSIVEEYGFEPHELPNIWAMTGDSSDNIPGVRGVGEKTAVKLLRTHGSLDKALSEAPKLEGQEELVRRNLDLIKLDGSPATLNVREDECLLSTESYDSEVLQNFFRKWEMESLRSKEAGIGIYN